MYCKNCGNQIDDNAVVCVHCGVTVDPPTKTVQRRNDLAIIGFVLSFFTALIGLVISAIALHKAKTEFNGDGKGFAIAGVVIGSIEVFVALLSVIIFIAFTVWAASIV